MFLKNGRDYIELKIVGYQYPDKLPRGDSFDDDANWLNLYCKKDIDGTFQEGIDPSLQTVDVERVVDLLQNYRDGNTNKITFGGLEPNFWLHLNRTWRKEQHKLTLFFWNERGGEGYSAVKPFIKTIDDRELGDILHFWQQALQKFPVR